MYMCEPSSCRLTYTACTSYCCSHAHTIRSCRHMVTFPTVRSCVVLLAIKVPVSRKGPSGQTHLYLVTSYNPSFNDVIEKTAEVLEFIPCQATLVALDLFLYLALIVHEGLPHSTKRRRRRKAKSSLGEVVSMETSTISTLPVLADSVSY